MKSFLLSLLLSVMLLQISVPAFGQDLLAPSSAEDRGKFIYVRQCANCHGSEGQGVADKYDETLHGNKSLDELAKLIHETMPDEHPEQCVDDDARAVAGYIYETFYTDEARARNAPPRIDLVRLTASQHANTITDLFSNFLGTEDVDQRRGLSAEYYASRNFSGDKKKLERIDQTVSFQFAEGSPAEGIEAEEFSIRWDGSVIADETGDYAFCVKSENGIKLYVNDRETPLIDGWVASGGEVVEHRQKIHLLGGRAYPLQLDFFKYKDKTASVELLWCPPGGIEKVIPLRHLAEEEVPASFVIATPFPADDASSGYERGVSISKAWDTATTQAALEAADYVVRHLNQLARTRDDSEDRKQKIKEFCLRFVELAFRRPLTPELKELYVDQQLAKSEDLEAVVKRIVLLTLKSPRFLYVELNDQSVDAYDVAARLALGMWDSLPDEALLKAAATGQLLHEQGVRQQAQRMLNDPRTKQKLRGFFHELLPFDEAADLAKDLDAYPGFDDELIQDLKASLEMFIERIVWSDASDYRELLLSSEIYFSQRMAEFYDVAKTGEGEFEPISFDPSQRAGVVTHPFLLSALSYHRSSSPIHRGVFVTRKILRRSLKPPPMAIEFMENKFDPSLSMREKVTELTKSSNCMGCHCTINPLGFSFENYDAVGRFRTEENNKPVNSTSDFTDYDGHTVTFTGARDVAEYAANDRAARIGFIEQLFHHTIKQPARAYGPETLDRLLIGFEESNFNIQKLLVEINVLAAMHGLSTEESDSP